MSRFIYALLLLIMAAALCFASNYPDNWVFPPEGEYIKGRALVEFSESIGNPIIEYKDGFAVTGVSEIDALCEEYLVFDIERANNEEKPDDPVLIDVSRWYILYFPEEVPVEHVVYSFKELSIIDWCEPWPLRKVDYIPNDPMFYSSWHLTKIMCPEAWDYTHGDPSVMVAIIDSGTDMDHPDLESALWVNPGEDLNGNGIVDLSDWDGLDNDGNGYADDFWGWDFIEWDNIPDDNYPGSDGHGTHCAGDASAATDNSVGVSGTGFNCTIMTLRCGYGIYVTQAMNGYIYAGNTGAKIVSCSYGGTMYSAYEQNLITNAWNQGSVICCSAGNSGNNYTPHYPSMYQHCVSVGATDQNDHRASFSNYSAYPNDNRVDVMAPGVSIYSTTIGGGYGGYMWSGTSMATPIAAGVAAMIRTVAPNLTPAQVETVLCVSCDNIDNLNPGYAGLLGYGRVNAYNAMIALLPNLSIDDIEIVDDGNMDGRADPGETCDLILTLYNSPEGLSANNLTGQITCSDTAVTITNNQAGFGSIAAGSFGNNSASPYVFEVGQTDPHWAEFIIDLETPSWSGQMEFEVELGRPPILIVDDDSSYNYQTFYSISLNALNEFHDIWDESQEVITTEELQRYEIVIWETGKRTTDQLTAAEQDALEGYLNAGGDLVISSQNLGEEIGGTAFYSDYLHAQHLIDDVNSFLLSGIDGDPISGGTSLILLGSMGAGNADSPSAIAPLGTAESMFLYQGTTDIGAIRYEGDYQLLYFAFPFEAISGMASTTSRDTIMNNILEWFETAAPPPDLVVTLDPVNPPIQIPASGGSFQSNIQVVNNSATQTYIEDVWIDITLPSGTVYGPVITRPDVNITPGFNYSRELNQAVPAGAPAGEYYYWVHFGDIISGTITVEDGFPFTKLGTDGSDYMNGWNLTGWEGFGSDLTGLPQEYFLAQNNPNPFNPVTSIRFELPENADVTLVVFDIQGREIVRLVDGWRNAGVHEVTFNGSDLSSGVYFAKLQVNGISMTRKMLLVK
ncbi:S8 family serine peptidase [bacterium]|nr:S8 family serine peptidase [bacterium]